MGSHITRNGGECEHDFKHLFSYKKTIFETPSSNRIKRVIERILNFLFSPSSYSKCSKCDLMRHDNDGHTFRTVKEAIEEGS